jgi:hypothetical protein
MNPVHLAKNPVNAPASIGFFESRLKLILVSFRSVSGVPDWSPWFSQYVPRKPPASREWVIKLYLPALGFVLGELIVYSPEPEGENTRRKAGGALRGGPIELRITVFALSTMEDRVINSATNIRLVLPSFTNPIRDCTVTGGKVLLAGIGTDGQVPSDVYTESGAHCRYSMRISAASMDAPP